MPDGRFVAVSSGLVTQGLAGTVPKVEVKHNQSGTVLKIEPKIDTVASVVPPGLSSLADCIPLEGWNGWPDGNFRCFVTFKEYNETGHLKVNWACKGHGGDKTGSTESATYERGKRSSRQCLGALICDNSDCDIIIRPHTRSDGIENQILTGCSNCGSSLTHVLCPNRSKIWVYLHGVYYDNGVPHTHPRLPHVLGLLPTERRKFEAIVTANPKAGPLQLITGLPTIHGPGESVADISNCLVNADRVNKEKQKIIRSSGMGGDSFITAFSQFCQKNPGLVIFSLFSEVTVISLQTQFMASQLIKDGVLDGPVNGLVTDATHSFFANSDAKLIISSVYSPELCCWVPGIFSYVNGETSKHYEHHFRALFQSIAQEASQRGVEVVDETFIGVRHFYYSECGY